jgi:hypothetical protein
MSAVQLNLETARVGFIGLGLMDSRLARRLYAAGWKLQAWNHSHSGSIVGPEVLRVANILHEHAVGSAIGTSSHAIGTAILIRRSEEQGSVSSLAMAMAGVITAILASLLSWWLH